MKDHEIAQLVNRLTAVAVKYAETQQLREQIKKVVLDTLKGKTSEA
jgi:hypothetical protein